MLEARELSIRFGGMVAVDRVSFQVQAGELVGLVGPNGAGKTTLLRMLTGVLPPDSGQVHFLGQDVTRAPLHRRARLGCVLTHQIVRPFREMTLCDNVVLAAGHAHTARPWRALLSVDTREERERALQGLATVGIADAADKPAASVPLGYLKRLQVAMALALQPRLLLLDEPLAGLNYHEAARFADLLVRLNGEGLTLLLVEHNLGEVMRVAQRLLVLDAGRMLAEGEPREVMSRPEVRQAYLGGADDTPPQTPREAAHA
ncbi:MAG: branched-chain amino acid transport system ATP-binding protein [Pseudomonadota bacterium]